MHFCLPIQVFYTRKSKGGGLSANIKLHFSLHCSSQISCVLISGNYTGYIPGARRGRNVQNDDDVVDDGREYQYKPKHTSLEEMLSNSTQNVPASYSMDNDSSGVYLHQKSVSEVR